ncbi:MAG: excinuclease ABC subunit UvrB, partial [Alphaproteobacteria bacterium]|nr:excinuclease ABC subunit UvrB [Alphaproteobacteria bacterium]
RLGVYDILVGINLLREGLDIPECGLVAILDADKEGYLRSRTSLIQTIGRAARNVDGRAILYADVMTGSMKAAIDETNRRRAKQEDYNRQHNITPETVRKNISDVLGRVDEGAEAPPSSLLSDGQWAGKDVAKTIKALEKKMLDAASNLEFETAARLRDDIKRLEAMDLGIAPVLAKKHAEKTSQKNQLLRTQKSGTKSRQN